MFVHKQIKFPKARAQNGRSSRKQQLMQQLSLWISPYKPPKTSRLYTYILYLPIYSHFVSKLLILIAKGECFRLDKLAKRMLLASC